MSTSESWDTNRHTTRCTSRVSVVWQCKLVSGWGLKKWRSVLPHVPYGSETILRFSLYVTIIPLAITRGGVTRPWSLAWSCGSVRWSTTTRLEIRVQHTCGRMTAVGVETRSGRADEVIWSPWTAATFDAGRTGRLWLTIDATWCDDGTGRIDAIKHTTQRVCEILSDELLKQSLQSYLSRSRMAKQRIYRFLAKHHSCFDIQQLLLSSLKLLNVNKLP